MTGGSGERTSIDRVAWDFAHLVYKEQVWDRVSGSSVKPTRAAMPSRPSGWFTGHNCCTTTAAQWRRDVTVKHAAMHSFRTTPCCRDVSHSISSIYRSKPWCRPTPTRNVVALIAFLRRSSARIHNPQQLLTRDVKTCFCAGFLLF